MVITILIKQLLHQVHFKSLRSDRHRLIERTFINVKIIHAVHDMHFPVFAVLYPKHSPITGSPVIYSFKNLASNKKNAPKWDCLSLFFSMLSKRIRRLSGHPAIMFVWSASSTLSIQSSGCDVTDVVILSPSDFGFLIGTKPLDFGVTIVLRSLTSIMHKKHINVLMQNLKPLNNPKMVRKISIRNMHIKKLTCILC